VRDSITDTHVALTYLLLVMGATARGGRRLGMALALACFIAFNYFFLHPYYTLAIRSPLDWLILAAFLGTSALATQLLHRAQKETEAAMAGRTEALLEADRMKDALLASVSHDLRTPLTSIRAIAQDMAEDDPRALVVVEEADRLNHFVSDLLDLSRLTAGRPDVAIELIAAEDVLGAALQRLGPAAEARIAASIDPTVPVLIGRFDFVHTLRALVNLIDNALKYSPADAIVTVSVRRDDDSLVFEVADRGPGVPSSEVPALFDAFHRGSSAPNVPGTGLGLAIARRSAELQNGRLTYAPRDGGGSVFRLLLPAADIDDIQQISL
jgi:two-component system sensor histidine kinase KdpD